MKPAAKALAIVTSVVIVLVCAFYALFSSFQGEFGFNRSVDETGRAELMPQDRLDIASSLSGVTITADSGAREVTARLTGSYSGFTAGGEIKLTVERSGSTVTIRAGRQGVGFIGWSSSVRLDVVIPADYAGDLYLRSTAGSLNIDADLALQSLDAHTSAGRVQARGVKAAGIVKLSSSAGSVTAGAIEAADMNLQSSAGRVEAVSCKAASIRIHSSAGSVKAGSLSGRVDVSSSAGPVTVKLADVTADVDISSSAGSVNVTLPRDANASIEAWTSAGTVSVNGLDIQRTVDKRSKVAGTLGSGGPQVRAHSSAGAVRLTGE